MGEFFALHCTSCGTSLEIPAGIDQFACGNCGVTYQVKRGGGIVSIVALIKETESNVTVPASLKLPESGQAVEVHTEGAPSPISEERSIPTLFQEEKPKLEEVARNTSPPVAKPAWPVERETRPPWQNPPRRQPIPWGKYLLYLLILGVILALTNPSKERQEEAIGKQIVAYTRSVGGDVGEQIEGEPGGIGGLIGWLTGSFVGGVVEEALMQLDIFQYNNYYLVSTMTLKDKVISFGILRFTILVTPVEEWMTDMDFNEILSAKISGSEVLGIVFGPMMTSMPQMLTPVSPSTNQSLDSTSTTAPVVAPTKAPTKRPATIIPSETPPLAITITPSGLKALFTANESMYCRAGPDISYEDYTLVLKGQSVPALAKWFNNNWILVGIDNPDTRTKCCWVGGDGDLSVSLNSLQSINTLPDRIDCPYYP